MTSQIHSSPAAQWLQGLLAKGAPSQGGSHSNTGSTELPQDSSRISTQAFQLNQAAGTSLSAHARTAQSSGVSAAHHHRPHHRDDQNRDTSFVSSAAHTTVSHLQERVSKVANDLRVAYSHAGAPEAASAHHNSGIR